MPKEKVYSAPNLHAIKDRPQYASYLERMAKFKRRVHYGGRWWNDPRQLKHFLGL